MAQVQVTIPDELLNTDETGAVGRRVVEEFALEGYKSGAFGIAQVRRLLGFATRYEVDGFLKRHNVFLEQTFEDVMRDSEASREVSQKIREQQQ